MPDHKKKRLVSKKKKARNWRKDSHYVEKDSGQKVSHRMAWTGDPSKKKGDYKVFPTVAPKKGKENSRDEKDWKEQGPREAEAKGETISFKRKKKAEKFAAGSWKKGKDKKDAMKAYRKSKKVKVKKY